jgi:hypothetical protein
MYADPQTTHNKHVPHYLQQIVLRITLAMRLQPILQM